MKIVKTLLLILLFILIWCLFTSEAMAQSSSEQNSFQLSSFQHMELVAYAGLDAPSLVENFQPKEFGYVRKYEIYAAYKGDMQKVKYGRRWGLFGRPTWWVDGQRITIRPKKGSGLDLLESEKYLFLIEKQDEKVVIQWWWDDQKGTVFRRLRDPEKADKAIP